MLEMGSSSKLVDLIMLCVSIVSFSVLLNGKLGVSFQPTRGIRQGDPLSPYLFIMVSEVLSCMINRAYLDNRLVGLRLGATGPMISHLLFANDSLFFLMASVQNC